MGVDGLGLAFKGLGCIGFGLRTDARKLTLLMVTYGDLKETTGGEFRDKASIRCIDRPPIIIAPIMVTTHLKMS